MPFNGSGIFQSLPSPTFPAVAGQVIYAERFNSNLSDIFQGLTNCVTRDGQSPASANLPMNGFKLTGLGDGTTLGQALVYGQASSALLNGPLGVGGTPTLYNAAGRGELDINGSSTALLGLGVGGSGKAYFTTSATVTEIGSVGPGTLRFVGNVGEMARFDTANGRLGLGTTTPAYPLDLSSVGGANAIVNCARLFANASANASARLVFGTAANGANSGIRGYSSSATGGNLMLETANETDGVVTTRMQLDGYGNIGVNVAPPFYGSTITSLAMAASVQPIFDLYVGATRTASFTTTAGQTNVGSVTAIPVNVITNGLPRLTVSPAGVVTYGSDEVGFRDVPRVTGGFERGKCFATSAGVTINTAAPGYTYSIYNDSAAVITLTQGAGVTLRLAGTGSTGNRTLQPRGMATFWFNTASEPVIFGAGVA